MICVVSVCRVSCGVQDVDVGGAGAGGGGGGLLTVIRAAACSFLGWSLVWLVWLRVSLGRKLALARSKMCRCHVVGAVGCMHNNNNEISVYDDM